MMANLCILIVCFDVGCLYLGYELDPQVKPEKIMRREVGLRKLDFFHFGLFLNSSATDIVLVTAQHGS